MTDRRLPPPSSIPPAPPPPPLKAHRSYFERFVAQPLTTAYASRPSVQSARPDGGAPNPLVPKLPGIRTGSSYNASHKTGLDIAALDINRDRTHAVLAGKEILKTVRVHDAKIVDETNLRAAVLNYADSHARQREGLGVQDVKWSHGQFSSHIATAVANGKVILYDLNRTSVELVRLHEHTRQVHKLAFNPHQGHLLLSASHDATVRLWDLRDMRRDVAACRSRDQYSGMNGGIRDVQWSPTDAVDFAFGTDNGTIQRWDFRHTKSPKQKVTAHDQKTCTSIDWHPDGKHLLSASVDRTVKVWDFSIDGRRQKAAYVMTTPYPVYKARWRPPYWSDEHHDKGVYQSTQLITSYDRDHSVIHLWDFRRPHMPYREIDKFRSPPSDMLWHSRDTLWTVGKEGIFQQHDIHYAPKIVDRRPLQALAISPSGEIGGVAQKRPRRRRSAALAYSGEAYVGGSRDKSGSLGRGSLRSSADDSLDESFLGSSKRHHGRTASNRSTKSLSSTPPSDLAPKVMFLTDSMNTPIDSLAPDQLAFRGVLPGAANAQIFAYLAQKYKTIPLPDPPTVEAYIEIERVFQQNAEYAQRAAYHRLAQTWRIIGASISTATKRRAELHKTQMRLQQKIAKTTSSYTGLKPSPNTLDKHVHAATNPAVRAIMGTLERSRPVSPAKQSLTHSESTSNLATPLARPTNGSSSVINDSLKTELPEVDHDKIELGPAAMGPPPTGQGSSDKVSTLPAQSSFDGPNWLQSAESLDERRALIGSWRAPPRAPLSLNPSSTPDLNVNIPHPFERHDSGESFAMFSASTDSTHGSSVPSSFASGRSHGNPEDLPDNWQHVPNNSSFGKPRSTTDMGGQISPRDKSSSILETGSTRPFDQHKQLNAVDSGTRMLESSSGERATQEMSALRRTNQLLRHDSSEYGSSREGTSMSSTDYNPDMEASGTIVPEFFDDARSPLGLKPHVFSPRVVSNTFSGVAPTTETKLVLSDFQAMHIDAEAESPFSVIGLLDSILGFHTETLSDAQFPSILLLLLEPLLPQTHSPSGSSAVNMTEILATFSDTFTSLGLTPTQAKAILSTQLSQLISTGINPYQAESILQTYHAQLHSLALFNSAASLRRLTYPTYPAVYEQALRDTQLGLLCLSCKSPINNPKDKMQCESCKRAQAPCPICWGKFPAFEPINGKKKARLRSSFSNKGPKDTRPSVVVQPADVEDGPSPTIPEKWNSSQATLWTWCSLCGHGGHTSCISTWFVDSTLSDGACPTEGCLCDCVQGKRRDDKIQELLQKKLQKERAKTVRKGNDWKVGESKAVSAVRGSIGDGVSLAPTSANQTTLQPGGRREDHQRSRTLTAEHSYFGPPPRITRPRT